MITKLEVNMKNVSLIRADAEKAFSDDHLQVILSHFQGSGNPPNIFFHDHTWILYIYILICLHGFIMNSFLVWLVNSRLDFAVSIKIFFSMESLFRIIHCGFTQPLKLGVFLYGWVPAWLIRVTTVIGDLFLGNLDESINLLEKDEHWLTKHLVCSIPVHLDFTALFGLAIFIVMCNSSRLYFVWTEAKPDSSSCLSCFMRPTERAFSIRSTIVCLVLVCLYWLATWIFAGGSSNEFAKACLKPNDVYTMETGNWWMLSAIVGIMHGLSITLCAVIYIWLSLEENEMTLITTKRHTLYIAGIGIGHALILIFTFVAKVPFMAGVHSNTGEAVLTNMSIVAGNGIFWPYAVIWASSQARKETISFLQQLYKSVITCNFKPDNQPGLPQRLQAIKDWKENERKSKVPGNLINERFLNADKKIDEPTLQMPIRNIPDSKKLEISKHEYNDHENNSIQMLQNESQISVQSVYASKSSDLDKENKKDLMERGNSIKDRNLFGNKNNKLINPTVSSYDTSTYKRYEKYSVVNELKLCHPKNERNTEGVKEPTRKLENTTKTSNNTTIRTSELSSIIQQYSSTIPKQHITYLKTNHSIQGSSEHEGHDIKIDSEEILKNEGHINDKKISYHSKNNFPKEENLELECMESRGNGKEFDQISVQNQLDQLAAIMDEYSVAKSKKQKSSLVNTGETCLATDNANARVEYRDIDSINTHQLSVKFNNWTLIQSHTLEQTQTDGNKQENMVRPKEVDNIHLSRQNIKEHLITKVHIIKDNSQRAIKKEAKAIPPSILNLDTNLPGSIEESSFLPENEDEAENCDRSSYKIKNIIPVPEPSLSRSNSNNLSVLGKILNRYSRDINQSQFVEFKIGSIAVVKREERKTINNPPAGRLAKVSDQEEHFHCLDEHTGIYLGSKINANKNKDNVAGKLFSFGEAKNNATVRNGKAPHFEEEKCPSDNSKLDEMSKDDKSLTDLRLLLNVFDHPLRYNINTIRDPIRQCNNISSVHLGDYGNSDPSNKE